jgi:hypothetical protein
MQKLDRNLREKLKLLVATAIFGVSVAPTFISYRPYLFRWDDAEYLRRSIAVSRAFWSGNVHGHWEMASDRPPAMTLLGIPWGSLTTWDEISKCFISLGAVISLTIALCLYLLLRIGIRPIFLVAASVFVFASIGPFPPTSIVENGAAYSAATGFMADSLFAWVTLAAVLLILLETRTYDASIRGAIMRGTLWGSILSLGVMIKMSFFYFDLLIAPILFVIRLRRSGLRCALAAFVAVACLSLPSAFYFVGWGRRAFGNADASSFGGVADFYYTPLPGFLANSLRESPGLGFSFMFVTLAFIFLLIKRPMVFWKVDFLALVIIVGFGIIVLASANRQIRYAFPVIIALPFLVAIFMSDRGNLSIPHRPAAFAAIVLLCGLLTAAVPTGHRADKQSLSRPDAVLAQAAACNAKSILLATDSPTLNRDLMQLAMKVASSSVNVNDMEVATLAYQVMSGTPIEKDLEEITKADEVIFQDSAALSPPFTNRRVPDYERYVQESGHVPIRLGNDLSVYSLHCAPRS